MNDVFVIEIAVKAGEKGELYETGKHEVTPSIIKAYYLQLVTLIRQQLKV